MLHVLKKTREQSKMNTEQNGRSRQRCRNHTLDLPDWAPPSRAAGAVLPAEHVRDISTVSQGKDVTVCNTGIDNNTNNTREIQAYHPASHPTWMIDHRGLMVQVQLCDGCQRCDSSIGAWRSVHLSADHWCLWTCVGWIEGSALASNRTRPIPYLSRAGKSDNSIR